MQIRQDEAQDICPLSERVSDGLVGEDISFAIKPEWIRGAEHGVAGFNPLHDLSHNLLRPVSHLVVETWGFLIGTDRHLVRNVGGSNESIFGEERGKLEEIGSHIGVSQLSNQLVEGCVEAQSHLSVSGAPVLFLHP